MSNNPSFLEIMGIVSLVVIGLAVLVAAFANTEVRLEPGGREIILELGDGFVAKFTSPPKPPKRYSFAEAYAMMRKGDWMKPQGSTASYRWNGVYGCWHIKNQDGTAARVDTLPFVCIDLEWNSVEDVADVYMQIQNMEELAI